MDNKRVELTTFTWMHTAVPDCVTTCVSRTVRQGRRRFLHRCGRAICVQLVIRLQTVSLTSQGWLRKDRAETNFFFPPSFSPSPSIVSLLLSALSSSFRSPETEGRAAAVPQRKGKDLRKGLKKRKEKGDGRSTMTHKCHASNGAPHFLFHTCLCGHSGISAQEFDTSVTPS
ncbi:hypothetical protein DPX16_19366 [Anabarilius grahami]|uniref:Uncharacterized protein n=1 Tax=Anabarilius grahami TaxID=495550 RepID=A0A3N0YZW8_ANAGA|nr:hypothetical protein DPX16_19366 [Anabarilius grahami]